MSNNSIPGDPINRFLGILRPKSYSARSQRSLSNQEAMNGETLQRLVTITNPQGFHMRPATAFAQLAGKFKSEVTVRKGDMGINGKSPLELMFLGADQGSELTLVISGVDAQAAMAALAELLGAASVDGIAPPSVPPKG